MVIGYSARSRRLPLKRVWRKIELLRREIWITLHIGSAAGLPDPLDQIRRTVMSAVTASDREVGPAAPSKNAA